MSNDRQFFYNEDPLDDETLAVVEPILTGVFEFTQFNAGESGRAMPSFEEMEPVLFSMFLALVRNNPAVGPTDSRSPVGEANSDDVEWAQELVNHPEVYLLWARMADPENVA